MSFKPRLKGLQHALSLDPFKLLFMVPNFAWETKKHPKTEFLPIFNDWTIAKSTIAIRITFQLKFLVLYFLTHIWCSKLSLLVEVFIM